MEWKKLRNFFGKLITYIVILVLLPVLLIFSDYRKEDNASQCVYCPVCQRLFKGNVIQKCPKCKGYLCDEW